MGGGEEKKIKEIPHVRTKMRSKSKNESNEALSTACDEKRTLSAAWRVVYGAQN
jgi:hypothetical protein